MGLPVTGLLGALRDVGERGLTDFKQSLIKLRQNDISALAKARKTAPRRGLACKNRIRVHPRPRINYPPAFGNCSRYLQIASISGGENL